MKRHCSVKRELCILSLCMYFTLPKEENEIDVIKYIMMKNVHKAKTCCLLMLVEESSGPYSLCEIHERKVAN